MHFYSPVHHINDYSTVLRRKTTEPDNSIMERKDLRAIVRGSTIAPSQDVSYPVRSERPG